MPKTKNYKEIIIELFKRKQGAFLGSEVIDELHEKCGISKTTAATVLKRLSAEGSKDRILFSSNPVKMQGNQFAYCYGKFDKLAFKKLLQTAKPSLYAALERFYANGYLISEQEFCKVSGCFIAGDENSKYYTLSKLLKDMGIFHKLERITIEGAQFITERGKRFDENSPEYLDVKGQRAVSCTLIPSIIAYCKNINLLQSADTPHFVNKSNPFACFPEANNMFFDITGFSKTSGLMEYADDEKGVKLKKSMVVFDVKIDESEYSEIDFIGFSERVKTLVFSTSISAKRKIIPVIVCKCVNNGVKKAIQEKGFLLLSLSSIYGKLTNRMISFIRKTEKQTSDFTEILDNIDNVGIQSLETIKGEIFEMLVERVIRQYYGVLPDEVEITSRLRIGSASKVETDIDILITENKFKARRIAIECKAYANVVRWKNPKDSLENGFDETNTYARRFFNFTLSKLCEKYGKNKVCLCMISANGFDDETRQKVLGLSDFKHEHFELLYSAKELVDMVASHFREQKIPYNADNANLIEKYFIRQGEQC